METLSGILNKLGGVVIEIGWDHMQFNALDYIDARERLEGFCLNCQIFVEGPVALEAQRQICPKCRKETVYGARCSHLFGFIQIKSQFN